MMPARQPMCALPKRNTRVSPDSVWPLRDKDGLTWAERAKMKERNG